MRWHFAYFILYEQWKTQNNNSSSIQSIFVCFYNDLVKWLGTICEFLSIFSGKNWMKSGALAHISQYLKVWVHLVDYASRLCRHAIEIGIIELSLIQFPIFPLLPSSRPSYNSKQILPVSVHLSHWRPFLLYLYVFGSHVFHALYWEWLLTESVTINTMDTQMLC